MRARALLQNFRGLSINRPEVAMSLALRNLQRAVPLRRALLRQRLQAVRGALGVQAFDLGVVCVDNRKIRQMNRVYREQDTPTDVLSFPFYEVKAALRFTSGLPSAVNSVNYTTDRIVRVAPKISNTHGSRE